MEVELTPNLEDAIMRELYEASLDGSVSKLNSLLQKNRSILNRVSLSPFGETPLHIAALFGHLEFCQVLLDKKPSLANEGDTKGRCPLHLASAEGHIEVVTALLQINPNNCLSRDRDEKLPLHLAAMRGRMGAIRELTTACPDSVKEMTDDDGSVLHLCVLYNHLEALKFLVELVSGDQQFLAAKDKEGNTVLHLAVRLKQIKTIKYLLSLPEMRTTTNALNGTGFTALDVLERCPGDFISLSIADILTTAGVQRSANISTSQVQQPVPSPTPSRASQSDIAFTQQPASPTSIDNQTAIASAQQHLFTAQVQLPVPSPTPSYSQSDIASPQPPASPTSIDNQTAVASAQRQLSSTSITSQPGMATVPSQNITSQPAEPNQPKRWERWESFFEKYLQYRGNWIDEIREPLMVAATVIATMTFQSTLSPPGGAWQDDTYTGDCNRFGLCKAGTAIVGYAWSPDFLKFVFFNSASFFSSLCVVLVLISGFPLKNNVIMWILTFAMTISITFMLLTYMWTLGLVSPDHIYYRIRSLGYLLIGTWVVILVVVGLIHAVRLVFWLRRLQLQRSRPMPLSNGPVANVQGVRITMLSSNNS